MKKIIFLSLFLSQFIFASGGALLGGGGNTLGLSCSNGQLPEWSGTGFSVCSTNTGTGNAVFSDSPNFTTKVTFGNYHLEPCVNNSGNSGTAKTLDLSTCSVQQSTLTGNVTYTLSNPVTGGAYVIKIIQGSGSYTVTWPGTVLWSGGTAPTITTTASQIDVINLLWDGTNYFGSFVQNY